MKCYQRGAQFTLLSGISPTLSYITHKSKLALKSLCLLLYPHIKFMFACVSSCILAEWTVSACDCKIRMKEEMCTNFPARSSVAPIQCSLARRIMINTHTHRRKHTHTHTHGHAWIKARIVNSLEEPTTNWLCNAKRKRRVSLPENFKGPRWDAHLLWEIFYLDAIAAVAPQQASHISRKPHTWNSVVAFFPFFFHLPHVTLFPLHPI